ncbi:protein kinase domain-containing protein [Cryptosporidium muris RN66]|uniref:Protein kinase domain-containing protein n=1 Tax=Cryptosporidium muris (strain RN66) TaxID=441375 RepID=B6ACQ7_CRYMR|nr:protein kinase domain-containing protein [Cryptosporidium muris RN66]EEA05911.1 protein kinase domain-containing protein [Cryptosporidium muris RN66]|eukprot:XP_002140260.1 protein kinase domain-containing protein [Cryptosporidium muris RN66]
MRSRSRYSFSNKTEGLNIFTGQSGVRYIICEQLGTGSASTVFRCFKLKEHLDNPIELTDEKFAVKVIDTKSIYLDPNSEDKKMRLLSEAMILQKLRHPHIVSLVDYAESGDKLYLVMELIEGGELFYKIVECGSLSEDNTRFVLKQIIDALYYMHNKDVIHRDLKPENILIYKTLPGPYYQIKVADFGVAKFLKHGYIQARTLVGTPQYWAPEVLTAASFGDTYGPEVDLWSLGVLFYVMLGGAFPFDERKGHLETLIRQGNYHFRYPRFQNVSIEAKNLICRLLTVDPKERLTLKELMNNPWLLKANPSEPIISTLNLDNSKINEPSNILESTKSYNTHATDVAECITIADSLGSNAIDPSSYLNLVQATSNGKINDLTSENSQIIPFVPKVAPQSVSHAKFHLEGEALPQSTTSNSSENINTPGISSKTLITPRTPSLPSTIMEINGLLDLQFSVAYKLQGVYMAFRHNSTICRILQQHIHKWRILQQQSCLAIARFKQTCESVLDELPDFLLAVNNNEPKLAIALLSHVRQWVATTESDVEDIQNGYNKFLLELSEFVESVRDMKRVSETSLALVYKSSQHETPQTNTLKTCADDSQSLITGDNENNSETNLISFIPDTTMFLGYNVARDRVLRRIADLFCNSDLETILDPISNCTASRIPESSIPSTAVPKIISRSDSSNNSVEEYKGHSNNSFCMSNNDHVGYQEISNDYDGYSSSHISSLWNNTRDLLLDFIFLPVSIRPVPPGIESVLQGSSDSGWFNLVNNLGNHPINDSSTSQDTNKVDTSGISRRSSKQSSCIVQQAQGPNLDEHEITGNQLKVSYILVRVLAQLRMIENVLGRCAAFWGNMNITIEKILQLRQHAEKLLGFTENPTLRTRFDERVAIYQKFWQELRDICEKYLQSAVSRQTQLENQVAELMDTATRVDTIISLRDPQSKK